MATRWTKTKQTRAAYQKQEHLKLPTNGHWKGKPRTAAQGDVGKTQYQEVIKSSPLRGSDQDQDIASGLSACGDVRVTR